MGRYLPGYKDGGPVRSIKNLTDRLGDEYDFRILTCDRDHGDEEPYPGILYQTWNPVGKAMVRYVKPGGFTEKAVLRASEGADLIYVCGCFNDYARTVLKLKKEEKLTQPVVIAAMGLFSPGAFHIHYAKKKAYMIFLRALGYFRNVEWSATSEEEAADIRREVGARAICHLAEDLPRVPNDVTRGDSSHSGSLKVIFLSRISRKKNLTYATNIIRRWADNREGRIRFDIYGNLEDQVYWEECQRELKDLPYNVIWKYKGIADAEKIPEIFAQYDVFLFPTLGENYGHVIFEALSGGCIPVISDQTPWTVEKMGGNGERYSLESATPFITAIDRYNRMGADELHEKAMKCMEFAKNYRAVDAEEGYRKIFDRG